jgi:hypothetical protein
MQLAKSSKSQVTGPASRSQNNLPSTLRDDRYRLSAPTSDSASWPDAKYKISSRFWEKALHGLSQDKDKRELLDGYEKAVVSELIGRKSAVHESSNRDISTQEVVKWLISKSTEQKKATLKGRELAGSTAKAISSIAQNLTPAGGASPYIGLACAGLCILTLVCS